MLSPLLPNSLRQEDWILFWFREGFLFSYGAPQFDWLPCRCWRTQSSPLAQWCFIQKSFPGDWKAEGQYLGHQEEFPEYNWLAMPIQSFFFWGGSVFHNTLFCFHLCPILCFLNLLFMGSRPLPWKQLLILFMAGEQYPKTACILDRIIKLTFL